MAVNRVIEPHFPKAKPENWTLLVDFWPNFETKKQIFCKRAHIPQVSVLIDTGPLSLL